MQTRGVFLLGLSLAVSGLGCGGSAVLLESPGDGGPTADGATTGPTVDGATVGAPTLDGASTIDGCSAGGTRCIPPGLLDGGAGSEDSGGGAGGDASACPTGITWTSPEPGEGQPCPTEGQICEDDTCKNNCAEPCNSTACFECPALTCTGGTWQSSFVQLENCDAGVFQTTAPSCSVASDCRLFSVYCANGSDACTCDVLGASEPNPVCEAGGDACLKDPCDGLTVVCDESLHCAMQ